MAEARVTLTTRVLVDDYEDLIEHIRQTGDTQNEFVVAAIREKLDRDESRSEPQTITARPRKLTAPEFEDPA